MLSDASVLSNESTTNYLNLDSSLPFSEYIAQCRTFITERRIDLLQHNQADPNRIIDANCPYEYPPLAESVKKPLKYGALLIHGLWDSPFSLKEIAISLTKNGILSRAILLPGHGTRPADLQHISYQDWINATTYGIHSLRQEVEHIFLIGYSAGAALSIYQALQTQNIAGVIALAPAIRVKPILDFVLNWRSLIKWFSKNKQWIYREDEIDYAKYKSIGFNPAIQIYQLTHVLKKLSQERKLNCPLLMAMSEHDETISSQAAIKFFSSFQNPVNQLILYTNKQKKYADPRIVLRKCSYPDLGIENFSHVSLPFSSNNEHYGSNGDYCEASHYSDTNLYGAYNRVGERFYKPFYQLGLLKKCKRELTYNPDFDFMSEQIVKFIKNVD